MLIRQPKNVIFCSSLYWFCAVLSYYQIIMLDLQEHRRRAVRWLYSDAGQLFISAEATAIDRQLQSAYGVHLLQLGILDATPMFDAAQHSHCFALATEPVVDGTHSAVSTFHDLPLENDSIDCVLIHHVLEFSADPHAILREAARVVRPEGRIIIALFNPWSFLGLQQKFSFDIGTRKSWQMQSPGSYKLSDWLRLLDFSVLGVDSCWHLPLFRSAELARRLSRYERPLHRISRPLGAGSIISASKRRHSMTPVRQRWTAPGLAVPIMKPSTHVAMNSDNDG